MDPTTEHRRFGLINTTLYVFYALFALFAVLKILLPQASGGWSDPPVVDYVFILLFGICFAIIGIGYSFHAWTKSAEEYNNWRLNQKPFGLKRTVNLTMFSPEFDIWSARIILPLGALFGIGIIGFAAYFIFTFLMKQ